MQAFRFRLDKVLEWYSHQYELEERRFHTCLAALTAARQAQAALDAERLAVERDILSRSSIPALDFVALGRYRLGARKREAELNSRVERCQAEVDSQRLRLVAAQRKVRLLEKLRERRVNEYVHAEARELEELAADAFFAKWASQA